MLELARHTRRSESGKNKEKDRRSWSAKIGQAVLKYWTASQVNTYDKEKNASSEEENSHLTRALSKHLAPISVTSAAAQHTEENNGKKKSNAGENEEVSGGTQESPVALLTGSLSSTFAFL